MATVGVLGGIALLFLGVQLKAVVGWRVTLRFGELVGAKWVDGGAVRYFGQFLIIILSLTRWRSLPGEITRGIQIDASLTSCLR